MPAVWILWTFKKPSQAGSTSVMLPSLSGLRDNVRSIVYRKAAEHTGFRNQMSLMLGRPLEDNSSAINL